MLASVGGDGKLNAVSDTARPKLDALTSLRFFAAFAIVLYHLQAFGITVQKSLWGFPLAYGVSFFFVLSGFVLAHAYHGKITSVQDVPAYVAIRFFRIWPLHIATLGAAALFLTNDNGGFITFILATLMVHTWTAALWSAFAFNPVSWSISVEWFFYLLLPIILLTRPRAVYLWFVAIIFATAVVLASFSFASWPPSGGTVEQQLSQPMVTRATFSSIFPPMRLVEFVGGMTMYRLSRSLRVTRLGATLAQAAALAVFIVYVRFYEGGQLYVNEQMPIGVAIAYDRYGASPFFMAIILAFSQSQGFFARAISIKPLVYLGDTSFALYMVHQIVLRGMIESGLYGGVDKWTAALIAIIASLALASVLFHLIEVSPREWAKRTFRMGAGRKAGAQTA